MKSSYKKSSSKLLFALVLLVALPISVFLVQQSQDIRQRASEIISPSGENMPLGNIPGWQQIFVDDFTTDVALGNFPSAVSDKWFAYPDGWLDTSKNGMYYPSKVISVHDGLMDLHLHTENGVHMVSAPVPKLRAGTHRYGSGLSAGRYAVRFKADAMSCYKTAWLLWPDSEVWPKDGEIDFPEGNLDGTIDAFMHRQNATSGSDQDVYETNSTYSSWHTAVTEWRPEINDLKFYLDGNLIGHSTSRVPNTPMHWVLQTETSLSGCVPVDSTAGHVLIDWVAVYTPSTGSTALSPIPTNSPTGNIPTQTVADTQPPVIAITAPLDGSIIKTSSKLAIGATTSDAGGVAKVEFYVGGNLKCTKTSAPYSCVWSVPGKKGASYTITAKATDFSGNTGSNTIVVSAR
jgi:hypothetical protein